MVPGPFDWPRGLGASLRWDPIRRPPCWSWIRLRASQAFCLLGPWPCTGSPIVVPDSIALGRLSKPLGAQPSNPWTIMGSMPFVVFSRIFKCGLGSLVFVLGAGGAPKPPHRARGWSGVPLTFYSTLTHPFRSDRGVVCQAHSCASPGRWVSAKL